MLGRGSLWQHQKCPACHDSSRYSLIWKLARSQSIMTLDQVRSRGSMTQLTKLRLTKLRLPYWIMVIHLSLKVTSCSISSPILTSQMSMYHKSWTLMPLVRHCIKTMCQSKSIGISAYGHRWKDKTTKCSCLATRKPLGKSEIRLQILRRAKDLYARLMVLAKSNREINQKHAISNYEFTLTPRALFAPNGNLLSCTDKSKLMHLLEKLTSKKSVHQQQLEGACVLQEDVMNTATTDSTSCEDTQNCTGGWHGSCPEADKETSNSSDS